MSSPFCRWEREAQRSWAQCSHHTVYKGQAVGVTPRPVWLQGFMLMLLPLHVVLPSPKIISQMTILLDSWCLVFKLFSLWQLSLLSSEFLLESWGPPLPSILFFMALGMLSTLYFLICNWRLLSKWSMIFQLNTMWFYNEEVWWREEKKDEHVRPSSC